MIKMFDKPKILLNFVQYQLPFPEISRIDALNNCLINWDFFDSIICDPPYGIRATSRETGRSEAK